MRNTRGYKRLTSQMTHNGEKQRITSRENHAGQPSVWVCGCSFAYGTWLNDEESMPWQLQALLPDRDVRNLAVPGHATVSALVQLRDAVEKGKKLPETL